MKSPEAQKELQEEILNAKENGFTPDYNALIRKYFEQLEQEVMAVAMGTKSQL